MKKIEMTLKLLFLLLFLNSVAVPQQLEKMITPDEKLNASFNNFDITTTKLIRFEEHDKGITLDFRLPPHWAFATGKNLQTKFGRVDFAFYNGMLYSNSKKIEFVSFRTRIYPDLFTDKIKSNAYVIGFQKQDQAAIIVVAEKAGHVNIEVDKSVLGRKLVFDFYLNKNECRLIRIMKKYPPYLP